MAAELSRAGKTGSVSGIIVGILFVAVFALFYLIPVTATVSEALMGYSSVEAWIRWQTIFFTLAGAFSVPFAIGLRNVLRSTDHTLATIGATLLMVGILTFVVASALFSGAMGALAGTFTSATTTPAQKDAALVTATALNAAFGSVTLLAVASFAMSLAALGYVQWRAAEFRKWLAYLAFAGTVVTPLALIPLPEPIGGILFAVLFVILVAWIFATAAYLWRTAAQPTASGRGA